MVFFRSKTLRYLLLAIVLFLFGAAENARGQDAGAWRVRLSDHRSSTPDHTWRRAVSAENTADDAARVATARLVLGAAGGWGIGFYGGALVGHLIGKYILPAGASRESAAFAGALLGMTVMTPLGAHVMNWHRGRYWPNLLAAALVTTGTALAMHEMDYAPYPLVGGAVVQISVSTLIEDITSPR